MLYARFENDLEENNQNFFFDESDSLKNQEQTNKTRIYRTGKLFGGLFMDIRLVVFFY